jgi:ParB family transcriptional regulator, chromosome partitioning protein
MKSNFRDLIMAKKRGLGRSLDALLVGSSLTSDVEEQLSSTRKESLAQIPMDQIQRGKYQPRREMDAEALEDLANSIRAQGVIQPIVLRQILGGRYEIVAGERRFRAASMAGLSEIPAIIKEIPDEAAVAIALIENIQRESLTPIEEAAALQRLLDEFQMTHQQVAEAVGKSRTTVTNMLRLLSLVDEVKILLDQRQLEMGHARALLPLTEHLQIESANRIIEKGLSVREAEEWVRRLQLPPVPESSKRPEDPDLLRLEQDLSHRLRHPVTIKCNGVGKGKVIIHYENLTELDAILEYFEVGERG